MSFPFAFWKPSGAPVFDPATLALTGWWRHFAASPEIAAASAGSSGANGDLTEATNPPGTTTLNGVAVAVFDGTNDKLANANNVDAFVTSSAWSGAVLANMTSAGAASPGSAYNEECLYGDVTNGFWSLSFSTRGWTFSYFDNTFAFVEVTIACATGSWHLVQFWYDGADISISLDDGAPATTAAPNPLFSAATVLQVGVNYDGTKFINGDVADKMIADSDLGATARTNLKLYANQHYGLAL